MSPTGLTAVSALAAVFTIAVLGKLRTRTTFNDFAESLDTYGIRPRSLQRVAAVSVLCAETYIVVSLVAPTGFSLSVRLLVPGGMLVVFTIATLVAARRQPGFTCHCFGSTESTRMMPHLLGNLSLIVVTVIGLAWRGEVAAGAGDRVLAVGIGLIVGIAVAAFGAVADALFPTNSRQGSKAAVDATAARRG